MKIFQLTILLFSMFSFVVAQDSKPSLKITGTVKEIAAQEIYPNTNSAFYIVYIELNLTLENNSSTPIILLQPEPSIYDGFVLEKGYKIEEITDDFLAKTPGFRTSFGMFLDDWKKIKRGLDKPKPPSDKTFILSPNEKINFEDFVRFNIPKFNNDYAFLRRPNQNLRLLQGASPLELYLDCETWTTLPLRIDGKSRESLKDEFAQKLQKKWKNHGYLWFEHIKSEPISINFNSIIFKNLID